MTTKKVATKKAAKTVAEKAGIAIEYVENLVVKDSLDVRLLLGTSRTNANLESWQNAVKTRLSQRPSISWSLETLGTPLADIAGLVVKGTRNASKLTTWAAQDSETWASLLAGQVFPSLKLFLAAVPLTKSFTRKDFITALPGMSQELAGAIYSFATAAAKLAAVLFEYKKREIQQVSHTEASAAQSSATVKLANKAQDILSRYQRLPNGNVVKIDTLTDAEIISAKEYWKAHSEPTQDK